jgi:hypothetical protein
VRERPWMHQRQERRRLVVDTVAFLWTLFLIVVVLPILLAPAPV